MNTPTPFNLTGQTALITGGGTGIGLATARQFARRGAAVVIASRTADELERAAARVREESGARCLAVPTDAKDEEQVTRLVQRTLDEFGRIDILVNNAGGSRPFDGLGTLQQWEDAMTLNFHAGRELAHAVVDGMCERRFGRIVNLTGGDEAVSINGGVPPNGAVHIWAKALSRLVGPDGVTVNCIPPGRIHSEQIDHRLLPTPEAQAAWVAANCPAGYIGEPDDLAVLVTFLCSPLARYITGQVIHVDGGARRFPH